MAENSNIEWTEATWNPLAGCKEISPGCTNCYAAPMAHRLEAMGQAKYAGTTRKLDNGKIVWTGKITLDEAVLTIPLKRKKPTVYFVNSMSDLFHENVPDEFICELFKVMGKAEQHTFQVLTKRADRMQRFMREQTNAHAVRSLDEPGFCVQWPYPNVWLGVSVEDQARADERIPHLLKTPAAVRFLSCEPLLGSVDLSRWMSGLDISRDEGGNDLGSASGGSDLDWVIVGGESGPGARDCDLRWIRSIVRSCRDAKVPCFVKQLGSVPASLQFDGLRDWPEHVEYRDGIVLKLRDKKGGDPTEWPADLRVREMPESVTAK